MNLRPALELFLVQVSEKTEENQRIYAHYDQNFLIDTYCGEARAGLALIENDLAPGLRLLEIGSGSGLLAGFLSQQGFDIVGLEPGAGPGFSHMRRMFDIVKAHLQSDFDLTRASVTELSPDKHGQFDLIFSVNVLEHIPPIAEGFRAMASVLAPTGKMLHTCPNYSVPYEPHFAIPLVPGSPALSKAIFLKPEMEERLPGIWEDLNWISVGLVRKFARDNGLVVTFEKGAMADALRRLSRDEVFASRHGLFLQNVSAVMDKLGLLSLIELLPASVITPMTFRMTKSQ